MTKYKVCSPMQALVRPEVPSEHTTKMNLPAVGIRTVQIDKVYAYANFTGATLEKPHQWVRFDLPLDHRLVQYYIQSFIPPSTKSDPVRLVFTANNALAVGLQGTCAGKDSNSQLNNDKNLETIVLDYAVLRELPNQPKAPKS